MSRFSSDIIITSFSTPFKFSGIYKYICMYMISNISSQIHPCTFNDIHISTNYSFFIFISEFMKEGLSYKYLTPSSLLTWYLRIFLPYIFYAQFGYLYSFSPSQFSKEKIKKYVEDSLVRNKVFIFSLFSVLLCYHY
jgi:hypothetical protein